MEVLVINRHLVYETAMVGASALQDWLLCLSA
jgi:hypothetical protein